MKMYKLINNDTQEIVSIVNVLDPNTYEVAAGYSIELLTEADGLPHITNIWQQLQDVFDGLTLTDYSKVYHLKHLIKNAFFDNDLNLMQAVTQNAVIPTESESVRTSLLNVFGV